MNLGAIPAQLRDTPHWLAWIPKDVEGRPKPTKVPVVAGESPTGLASTTDPSTWRSFEQAQGALGWAQGLGWVFTEDTGIVGCDLDDCIAPGGLHPAAREIVEMLRGYVELSPSGTGLHIYVRGSLNGSRNRTQATAWGGGFEAYERARFFTVTGSPFNGATTDVPDRQAELERVLGQVFGEPEELKPVAAGPMPDEEVIRRASEAANGEKFSRLFAGNTQGYGSPSEADQALCSVLAFWTQDPEQLDRLFRRSGLYRAEKWERSSYRGPTIDRALGGETYNAPSPAPPPEESEPDYPYRSLRHAMEHLPPEPKWLWRRRIAPGARTMVVAAPKLGKTTIACGFLRAVERDEDDFLGIEVMGDVSALMLSEEPPISMKDKYIDLQLEGNQVEILFRHEVLGEAWEKLAASAVRRCKEMGHQILIVDTISRWLGLTGEAENQSGRVTEAMEALDPAIEAGIAVVYLHHMRKGGGRHGEAQRGSNAFSASVDVVVELSHLTDEDNGPRLMKVISRFSGDEPPLAVTYADGDFEHTHDVESLKKGSSQTVTTLGL